MGKKLGAVVITVSLVLSAFFPVLAAAKITDISGNWAEKEIQYFIDKGFIVGYGDGTFLPQKTVTRAEFVRIVNNSFKFETPTAITFKDVKPGDWYYNDVCYAVQRGFISGYADNTFRPNKEITREEVASIIQRILQLPANTTYAPGVFSDVPANYHYNGAIGALTSAGIMKGTSSSVFSPKSYETRDDTAYSLYNALMNGTTENSVVDGDVFVRKNSYGPSSEFSKETVAKNLYIKSSNSETTVKNVTIQGDLVIENTAKSVYLVNVSIRGKLIVNGGNQLNLTKTDALEMDVNNARENIRIYASNDSICKDANIYTPCRLEEDSEALSLGFTNVIIGENDKNYITVELAGRFETVDIYPPRTSVNLTRGHISNLYFYNTAEYSTVSLGSSTGVDSAEIRASRVTISGSGTLRSAKIDAPNVSLQAVPTNLSGSYAPSYSSDVEKNNLVVTVVNRNNIPVDGAMVKVYETTKTTGSDGKATFTNVPAGNHVYSVDRTGFDSVSGTLDVTNYTTTRTVTLSSSYNYSISLTVQNNSTSAAVSSATVELKNVSTGYTSSGGIVSFNNLPTGTYTYTISAAGYSSLTDTITINNGNASKTIRLVPTSTSYDVDFYVRDSSTNAFINGATVTVDSVKQGATNYSGYVRLSGLSNGQHTYTISAPNYNLISGNFTISSKSASVNEVLTSTSLFTVVINVRDGNTGIPGAAVSLTSAKNTYTGTTDSLGKATLTGVVANTYSLSVTCAGYTPNPYTDTITVVNMDYSASASLTPVTPAP